MSFPKLLRYQRHFRNFWRTIEEYLDMPRADRLELDNICVDVADDAGRLPLSRRVLTLAMGGADGAEDIIAFCRRSPFVHCYEVDGKPYAVVPAVAVLNRTPQLKKGQGSELPPPRPNKHDDPALRLALEIVGLDVPWWSAVPNGEEDEPKPREKRPKSTDVRPKSELDPTNGALGDPKSRKSRPKSELDPAFDKDSSRAQARDRPDARASKPNQTKPRDQGDAPSVAPDQQPSPPGSTDARAIGSPVAVASSPALGGAGEATPEGSDQPDPALVRELVEEGAAAHRASKALSTTMRQGAHEATPGERDPPTKRTREPLTREEEAERVRELRRQLAAMEAS